jgi:DNA-binding transcriptional MerR regulator
VPITSTIGKVAQRTGLSVDTIRFYQKRGIIRSSVRTSSGYRIFAEAEIEDLQFIRRVQALGFSLKEIKDLVSLRQADHACPQVRDLIERKIKELHMKVSAMQELGKQLAQVLRKCNRVSRTHKTEACPLLDKTRRAGRPEE